MRAPLSWRRVAAPISFALLVGACGTSEPRTAVTFAIDPALAPTLADYPDGTGRSRPLAALRDSAGTVSEFATNEAIVCPESAAALDAFLARHGGEVVSSDAAAEPPAGVVSVLPEEDRAAACFTVRLDASAFPVEAFARNAGSMIATSDRWAELGVAPPASVDVAISSEAGLRILALVAHEAARGVRVSPSFVGYADDAPRILHFTEEEPDGMGGFDDALLVDRYSDGDAGSSSAVNRAMQWLAQRGFDGTVRVGIVDGGFFIEETTARPWDRILSTGLSDYRVDTVSSGRGVPLQYDHAEGDSVAEGPGRMSCTGGTPCPWHGRGSALTAAGWADNGYGMAGTGGLVAIPILQNVSSDLSEWKGAINTSLDWGAEVVSMSIGLSCDNVFCEIGLDLIDFWGPFERAVSLGVPVIAAAGNTTTNVDASQRYPCGVLDVICVGALADGTRARIDYSNYGATRVDVWAATNIPMMEPDDEGSLVLMPGSHGGTSAATPFVAGIVAMMKAADPGLTVAEVLTILRDTAFTENPDANVTYAVNALEAVRAAASGSFPDDAEEPNDTREAAAAIAVPEPGATEVTDLTVHPGDPDDYYSVTFAGWSRLAVHLEHVDGMTAPAVQLVRLGGGIPPSVATPPPSDATSVFAWQSMAPGEYLVHVRVDDAVARTPEMLYHMTLEQTAAAPLAPDAYELNETPDAARAMGRGTFRATHHAASDVDWYAFDVASGAVGESFDFIVRSSDFDLALELYAASDPVTPLATDSGRGGAGFSISTTGSYLVRVVQPGGVVGRYVFTMLGRTALGSLGSALEPPPYDAGFFRLDPDWVFLDLSVIDAFEDFLVPRAPGATGIRLYGRVDASLYDLDGGLLAAGVAGDDGQGNRVVEVSFGSLPDGESGILRVTRFGVDLEGLAVEEYPIADFSMQRLP